MAWAMPLLGFAGQEDICFGKAKNGLWNDMYRSYAKYPRRARCCFIRTCVAKGAEKPIDKELIQVSQNIK